MCHGVWGRNAVHTFLACCPLGQARAELSGPGPSFAVGAITLPPWPWTPASL